MDTSTQIVTVKAAGKRQRRSIAEKRLIVEGTLAEGASVARVARAHGVNANQVFYWCKLYRSGRLAVLDSYFRVSRHSTRIHGDGVAGHFGRASRSSLTHSATLRPVVSITRC
jgi:transposase